MKNEEVKKILEKQLQLLSERSNEPGIATSLMIDLSKAMCEIASVINSISRHSLERCWEKN